MSQNSNKGFTLIELMLAMTFVAALLLAIALTVIQISNIYNKGITMKEVDQLGRSLSSELQRGITGSQSFSLSDKYVHEVWGGRLCTGKYSYIWNYGTQMGHANVYKYNGTGDPIRFAKISDKTFKYCTKDTMTFLYPDVPSTGSTEMFNTGDRNLVLHTFNITSSIYDAKTKQQLYYIVFSLGTMDQVDIVSSNANCKVPTAAGSSKRDYSYCAVNEFNILAKSGNVY